MKDFSPSVLFAILHEIFGPMLWVLLGFAVVTAVWGIVCLLQRKRLGGATFAWAFLIAAVAGIAGAWSALFLTQASLSNVHGPLDWLSLGLVAVAVFGAVMALAYMTLSRRVRPGGY